MQLTLHSPLDMHLHLRDGQMLQTVAPLSAKSFAGALVMPNLVPPVTTKEMVQSYKERIKEAMGDEVFEPYMTLFFRPEYDYAFLADIKDSILAIKLYPAGITTNSEDGVDNFSVEALAPTLEAMSELGIPLCVHGETNGFVMDREAEFIPIYERIAKRFPDLKIIMEHITTKDAVDALMKYENLYATITLHHLYITLDDVAGGLLQPHLFCKPIAKRPEDRMALRKVALMAHEKVMFGSDSAPHPRDKKEAPGCAAGVFTAPIALPALAQLFEAAGVLENLQKFVSDNAQNIYGITPPKKEVKLVKEPFEVPSSYNNVVPMFAGESLAWRIAGGI
ncbi:dihydroorotase [Nitratiruptor tergarcus]|uniref:Dihydroorotase n=1 Tax=Nitratiruptor tergarcus DSM 16512 TaxID=1069081 RepID=A0A1W1WS72_9BACT|nr:dihydroorotase [Nitratiruptor tergarcus]SMC09147.1 dihydroorotase [Nitratiruptor tergarcus DSM 16512]